MGKYRLFIKPSALKELSRLSQSRRRLVIERIESLREDARPFGSVKLAGERAYRIRQGDYRIVYSVDDTEQAVRIMKIGHRKQVYR